jgi:hypothetical protein
MSVLHSGYLGWLALAAIPLILYLLFRRRRQEVAWGATYILKLALASGRRQTLWKQLVIVALRTLLLALLVLAFARPFQPQQPGDLAGEFPHGDGALHRIVLLDNSLSMNARYRLGSRMDEARAALAALLASLRAGDTAHWLPLCPDQGEELAAVPVALPLRRAEAQRLAAEVHAHATTLRLAEALRLAVAVFRQGAANHRQLVIVTDLSRSDYPRVEDLALFGQMLGELGVRVAILNLGDRAGRNLALESLTAGPERLLAGQPTNVYAEVVNYSDVPAEGGVLRLLVDGEPAGEQPSDLAPGQRRRYRFPVTPAPGEHRLEARLGEDAYPPDNRLEQVVHAVAALRVLLVTPAGPAAEGFAQPGVFLERSLAAAAGQPFRFALETLPADQFLAQHTERCDVIVLAEVASLSPSVMTALTGFVRRGGGLVLAAGPGLAVEPFQRTFAALAPATLTAPFRPELDYERYLQLQAAEIGPAPLREFETGLNGDLAQARVYNHWQLEPAPGASVVLRLTNGDPLLLQRPFGQGQVLLWGTSLGGAWTSLPVRQAYLPFVYRLLVLAAGHGRAARNVQPGQPLIAAVPGTDATLYLTTPDATLREVPVRQQGGQRFVRHDDSRLPGSYELRDAAGQVQARFVVAMPLAESDLRMLEPPVQARLEEALGARIAAQPEELPAALWRPGDGREWAAWAAAGVLLLLLLDAFATRRWFA